jgi:peptidoglycan/xylan/chitin deacetylase (PgdA/CDA1 family)
VTIVLRRIETAERSLFLTFDDGPDPLGTPGVLDVLAQHGARATFFLVAERAQHQPDLVAQIREGGHSIGNHSLDHRYGAFFRGRTAMLTWVRRSEEIFASLGCRTIGFRPPAGVRTPELYWALGELGLPLVLWRRRFFDSVWPWSVARADASLRRTRSGDIVLLHDRQKERHRQQFLDTLSRYLAAAKRAGFALQAMTH